MSDCCLTPIQKFFGYIMAKQVHIQWDDDDVRFVLDQHTWFDFYSAIALKQQSMDRPVVPLGHIILIPRQPVFALSPECCVRSGEATKNNFIVFGLTWSGLELKIYHTRGEHANHYTTDAIFYVEKCLFLSCMSNKNVDIWFSPHDAFLE
jgi:hypothetical protein